MDNENPTLTSIIEMIEKKLDEIKVVQKNIMSVEDLAMYLDLSPTYIRKMTHNREIPYYKPNGKKLYFLKEEIDEWVLSSRVMTSEELRREARKRVNLL